MFEHVEVFRHICLAGLSDSRSVVALVMASTEIMLVTALLFEACLAGMIVLPDNLAGHFNKARVYAKLPLRLGWFIVLTQLLFISHCIEVMISQ